MKKVFLIVYLVTCIFIETIGQDTENLKIGGYKYAYELKLNSPSVEYEFIIEERTKSDVMLSGGSLNKIYIKDNSMPVIDINKNIWGVFDGKSFYINTINYTGNPFFAKGEVIGKYIYFKATPPFDEKFKKEIGFNKDSYVPLFGLPCGAIGVVIQASQNYENQIAILLDIQTDKAICLSKGMLYEMIAKYPDLKKEYFSDTLSDSKEVVRKYIKKLSDKDSEISLTTKDIEEQLENKLKTQIVLLKENLYRIDTNISYKRYYENIIEQASHPDIEDIKLVSEEYSVGIFKSIGLEAKHNIKVEGDYSSHYNYVKIGTWRYFYENGQIKMLVDYDLNENKDGGLIKYDKNGNIKKVEEYKSGWKIK